MKQHMELYCSSGRIMMFLVCLNYSKLKWAEQTFSQFNLFIDDESFFEQWNDIRFWDEFKSSKDFDKIGITALEDQNIIAYSV